MPNRLALAAIVGFALLAAPARAQLTDAFFRLPDNISQSESLSSLTRTSPRSLVLAVDGGAYAVWNEQITHTKGKALELGLSTYDPLSGWQPGLTPVGIWEGERSTDPACALDRGGRLVVVWIDRRDGFPQVYAQAGSTREGLLSEPLRLSEGEAVCADPAIAVGPDRSLHVVWTEVVRAQPVVRHRLSPAGTAWLATDGPPLPDSLAAYAADVAVAVDGTTHLVWEWSSQNGVGIGHAVWSPDRAWSTVERITPITTGVYAQGPVVAIGGDGSVWVVWAKLDGRETEILLRRQPASSAAWEDVRTLHRGKEEVGSPTIAVDRRGVAHVLWLQNTFANNWPVGTSAIMYLAVPPRGSPRAPRSLTAPSGGPYASPMIATDDSGRIAAAWIDRSDGLGELICRMGVTGFVRR